MGRRGEEFWREWSSTSHMWRTMRAGKLTKIGKIVHGFWKRCSSRILIVGGQLDGSTEPSLLRRSWSRYSLRTLSLPGRHLLLVSMLRNRAGRWGRLVHRLPALAG